MMGFFYIKLLVYGTFRNCSIRAGETPKRPQSRLGAFLVPIFTNRGFLNGGGQQEYLVFESCLFYFCQISVAFDSLNGGEETKNTNKSW